MPACKYGVKLQSSTSLEQTIFRSKILQSGFSCTLIIPHLELSNSTGSAPTQVSPTKVKRGTFRANVLGQQCFSFQIAVNA